MEGGDGFAKRTNQNTKSVFLMGMKCTAENRFVVALDKQENLKYCFLLCFSLFCQILLQTVYG